MERFTARIWLMEVARAPIFILRSSAEAGSRAVRRDLGAGGGLRREPGLGAGAALMGAGEPDGAGLAGAGFTGVAAFGGAALAFAGAAFAGAAFAGAAFGAAAGFFAGAEAFAFATTFGCLGEGDVAFLAELFFVFLAKGDSR
jgi:hypothetical protein